MSHDTATTSRSTCSANGNMMRLSAVEAMFVPPQICYDTSTTRRTNGIIMQRVMMQLPLLEIVLVSLV